MWQVRPGTPGSSHLKEFPGRGSRWPKPLKPAGTGEMCRVLAERQAAAGAKGAGDIVRVRALAPEGTAPGDIVLGLTSGCGGEARSLSWHSLMSPGFRLLRRTAKPGWHCSAHIGGAGSGDLARLPGAGSWPLDSLSAGDGARTPCITALGDVSGPGCTRTTVLDPCCQGWQPKDC